MIHCCGARKAWQQDAFWINQHWSNRCQKRISYQLLHHLNTSSIRTSSSVINLKLFYFLSKSRIAWSPQNTSCLQESTWWTPHQCHYWIRHMKRMQHCPFGRNLCCRCVRMNLYAHGPNLKCQRKPSYFLGSLARNCARPSEPPSHSSNPSSSCLCRRSMDLLSEFLYVNSCCLLVEHNLYKLLLL